MFYERFEKLCHDNQTSPFALCKEIGLAGGTAAYWKKSGNTPKRETLEKIAEHFNVTVDYLLGRSFVDGIEPPKEPIALSESETKWLYILSRMTDENILKLRDYTRYLIWLQNQANEDYPKSQK